jgi:flagella basal body P-ring formation protein FlgA
MDLPGLRLCFLARAGAACLLALAVPWARGADDAPIVQQVRDLALAGAQRAGGRVEVEVGQLDPRLRLAPCERIEPYLPGGTRLWGRTRIGLRCTEGPSRWNVYLPVTVKVYGPALVAAAPLSAGAVIGDGDLRIAEVDLAAAPTAAIGDAAHAVGRTLARAVNAGQPVHAGDLKARQWFAAGDIVTIVAEGEGFRVAGQAQAMTAGVEGQPARLRTDSGRVLTGMPVGDRQVELHL